MRKLTTFALLLLLPLVFAGDLEGRTKTDSEPSGDRFFKPSAVETPNFQNCVHKYNQLLLCISNWGFFGSEMGGQTDCETGGVAASGEFPAGTQVEYLFQGALWIGAVVGEDTLVSVGADGWEHINEMWPCADASDPKCGIERRSIRPSDLYYHPDAKSDLDYIAVYSDTLVHPTWSGFDPTDARGHIPIYIQVTQTSYSWSVEYAQDFVLLDFNIENLGQRSISNLYLGIYSDGDVGHIIHDIDRYTDDICGFYEEHPTDCEGCMYPVNITYICDNDGDPDGGAYNFSSVTGILGTTVMRAPGEGTKKVSFNWWQGQGNPVFDWGPMLDATKRNFGTGGQGTPQGDKNKYYMLSNGEQDYDQIYSAQDFSEQGWLPPAPVAPNIANGGDTRFLLSFGPFDIDVGDSLRLTCAYVAGEALHKDPSANETYMTQSPPAAEEFYSRLNFSDLGDNAIWAQKIYDNPNVDTDGDDTSHVGPPICICPRELPDGTIVEDTTWGGDGVPDFRAATAPPPPVIRAFTEAGKVTLRWNGYLTETDLDPFTRIADFEGYGVYMGRTRVDSEFGLIEKRDKLDFVRKTYDPSLADLWIAREIPYKLDSLRKLYGENFDPMEFPCGLPEDGFRPPGDDETYCFEESGWNQSIEGWEDGAFVSEGTMIRKRFADEIQKGEIPPILDSSDASLWIWDINPITCDSAMYHKYWEYEFEMDNILQSVPWYFSVTAFDFGDFQNNLAPMESPKLANATEVWAINDGSVVESGRLEPYVYPNPYYGDGRYKDARYEDPQGFVDHSRVVHFANLPSEAKIKIYTLSGDLVKEIDHFATCKESGTNSQWTSKASWNMRSQHNELIASGIYLYSIETDYGHYVGKLVIIL